VFAEGNDPSHVYSASYDGTVRSWLAASGEFRRKVYSHGWGLNCLAMLPGGKELLFGSLNGATGIIDIDKGEVTKVLIPHEGPVLSIAVQPGSKLLATGGGDGGVNLWAIGEWALQEQHQNPYGPIWGIAFTADAKKMYYAGLDDFVTLWQVSPRKPFEQVEGVFPRRFQARENMSLGELQFARKCSVCHTLQKDDGNRAGPTLWGVFGRKAGTVEGYAYSQALKSSDIVWDEKTIGLLFDHGPQHVTPGSKMPLQRITDPEKREALIAYLKSATSEGAKENGAADGAKSKPRE
ncbi:MAG: c-type cytochrome, partial [Pseudomonadota bacterium]|nr:c-type cytochrome [Pseudomonadota bacterium]